MENGSLHGQTRRFWAALFIVVTSFLLAGSYAYYRVENDRIGQKRYHDLAAIAHLKAGAIEQWRKQRLSDVRTVSRDPLFKKAVQAWLRNPQDIELREVLLDRLDVERESHGCSNVILLSPDGRVLLCSPIQPPSVSPPATRAIEEALAKGSSVLSDLYRTPQGAVVIDAVAPITDSKGHPITVMVFRTRAESSLYPLIRSWPTPSQTSETLLVRRDGDGILFLNDLRHIPDTALSLRQPFALKDLPAVQAVLGKQGMFRGRDYRGADVLADLRGVPDSPWFMVAKVDTSEILAEARYRGGVVFLFSVLFILLAGAVTAFGYRHRQVGLFRDLYQSERERRAAQEQFRTTLYSIGDAVITTDTAGLVKQMNPVAERLTGWLETEAMEKPLYEVFHIVNEETGETAENPVRRVLAEGTVVGLANHTVLISRDGTERPIADSGAPIRDESDAVTGVVLVFRDQTEQRIAETKLRQQQEALQRSEAFLRATERMAKVGGWELDVETREVGWTEETYRIHEIPSDQKPQLGEVLNFFHDEDRPKLEEAIQHAIDHGEPYDMELRFITAEGRHLWTHIIGKPHLVGGKTVRLTGTIQDITERKKTEEALRESEERLRALFDSEVMGTLFGDIYGNIMTANDEFLRIVGYSRDDLRAGKVRWIDLTPQEFQSLDAKGIAEAKARGSCTPYEKQCIRKDGTLVWVLVGYVLLGDKREQSLAFILDISHRKIMEREREELISILEAKNAELERFAYTVSHDLKSPLITIESFTGFAKQDAASGDYESLKEDMETISRAAGTMGRLLNDLLELSRIGRLVNPPSEIPFSDLAGEAARLVSGLILERGVEVLIRENMPTVHGDRSRLLEVIQNLMENAVKFMGAQAHPQIEIGIEQQGGEPVFFVSDNGIGIDHAYRERVFGLFEQLDRSFEGTGIGLAVVRRIIELHGGRIWVDSGGIGHGTTFRFTLPGKGFSDGA